MNSILALYAPQISKYWNNPMSFRKHLVGCVTLVLSLVRMAGACEWVDPKIDMNQLNDPNKAPSFYNSIHAQIARVQSDFDACLDATYPGGYKIVAGAKINNDVRASEWKRFNASRDSFMRRYDSAFAVRLHELGVHEEIGSDGNTRIVRDTSDLSSGRRSIQSSSRSLSTVALPDDRDPADPKGRKPCDSLRIFDECTASAGHGDPFSKCVYQTEQHRGCRKPGGSSGAAK